MRHEEQKPFKINLHIGQGTSRHFICTALNHSYTLKEGFDRPYIYITPLLTSKHAKYNFKNAITIPEYMNALFPADLIFYVLELIEGQLLKTGGAEKYNRD